TSLLSPHPHPHPPLHPFPTRRSSDLTRTISIAASTADWAWFSRARGAPKTAMKPSPMYCRMSPPQRSTTGTTSPKKVLASASTRSEEHTSELQSRFDLVCRLLLEKKK